MVCKHLQDDNTCAIYHNRLSGHCVSIVEALQKHEGLVPATCGYLHYAPGYRPALAPETMDEFWQLVARHGTICMVSLKRLFPDSNAKKKELEVE
jgi:hypothetical protein